MISCNLHGKIEKTWGHVRFISNDSRHFGSKEYQNKGRKKTRSAADSWRNVGTEERGASFTIYLLPEFCILMKSIIQKSNFIHYAHCVEVLSVDT